MLGRAEGWQKLEIKHVATSASASQSVTRERARSHQVERQKHGVSAACLIQAQQLSIPKVEEIVGQAIDYARALAGYITVSYTHLTLPTKRIV